MKKFGNWKYFEGRRKNLRYKNSFVIHVPDIRSLSDLMACLNHYSKILDDSDIGSLFRALDYIKFSKPSLYSLKEELLLMCQKLGNRNYSPEEIISWMDGKINFDSHRDLGNSMVKLGFRSHTVRKNNIVKKFYELGC
jgi:hypothetical protein